MGSLILEDGSVVQHSNSYVDVAFADSYLGQNWAPSLEEKELALIQASEYLDVRWGSQFKGTPATSTQQLALPRLLFVDGVGNLIEGFIPQQIKKAVCLYAKEITKGTLYPDTTLLNAPIKKETSTVGPITESVEYGDSVASAASPWLVFPLADSLVAPFLAAPASKKNPIARVIR